MDLQTDTPRLAQRLTYIKCHMNGRGGLKLLHKSLAFIDKTPREIS